MLAISSPLLAYRADLEADPSRTQFTPHDADLLRLGSLLHRMTHIGHGDRDAQSRLAEEAVLCAERVSRRSGSGAVASIRDAATIAEDGGALRLANVILHLTRLCVVGDADHLEDGRILAHRARIARKAGMHDQAAHLYGQVLALGTSHELPELAARGHLGMALLARWRGNIPQAHELLELANAAVSNTDARDVAAIIQHELMVIAATRGKLDDALVHAWAAFRDVEGDAVREADALTNVGQVLFDAGSPAVALRAFLAALSRNPPKRIALPALGGAARAASLKARPKLVRLLTDRIDRLATGTDLLHANIYARGEAAIALAPSFPAEAEQRRQQVCEDAEQAGMHELAFQFAELSVRAQTPARSHTANADVAVILAEASSLSLSEEYAGV